MPYILRLYQENKLSLQLRNYLFPIHAVIGITNNEFFFLLIFKSINDFLKSPKILFLFIICLLKIQLNFKLCQKKQNVF